jgi:adenine-specific DNA-methyltransferase
MTPTKIDLVETFNYLIGLQVKKINKIKDCVWVEGRLQTGEKSLIIWRNLVKMNNDQLDEFFQKQAFSNTKMEYDLIYVNGDNNLPNLRRDQDNWKVRLIEEEFQRLMFG